MSEDKKKKTKDNDEIVINLDSFAVPGAIILAGLIIAAAIFFTNKNKTTADVNGSNDTANADDSGTTFEDAQTTISDAPYLGDKSTAKVAIVEFSDYQCPYCQRHDQQVYPDILKDYVDTGKVIYVFREFPLDFHGQIAQDSSEAALCVNSIAGIDTFAKFHDQAFAQSTDDDLRNIAKNLGVDLTKYDACMSSTEFKDAIAKDISDGESAGVQGTPGFVIGVLSSDGSVTGKLIAGAYPYDSFQTVIDEMLAK